MAPIGRDRQASTTHPLSQAIGIVHAWLDRGPLTDTELYRLAADRGLSASRVGPALNAMTQRKEIERTADRMYRLATIPTQPKES